MMMYIREERNKFNKVASWGKTGMLFEDLKLTDVRWNSCNGQTQTTKEKQTKKLI